MADFYFVYHEEQHQGPMPLEELQVLAKRRMIGATTYVSINGGRYHQAGLRPEICDLLLGDVDPALRAPEGLPPSVSGNQGAQIAEVGAPSRTSPNPNDPTAVGGCLVPVAVFFGAVAITVWVFLRKPPDGITAIFFLLGLIGLFIYCVSQVFLWIRPQLDNSSNSEGK